MRRIKQARKLAILIITAITYSFISINAFALSTSRGADNELYVVQTEGMSNGFSAYVYKSVTNSLSGVSKAEREDISMSLTPVRPPVNGREKVDFSSNTSAINYVKTNIYPQNTIKNAVKYASSYASSRGVGKITMAFKYDCYINGKRKDVLLYVIKNATASESSVIGSDNYRTSGYIVVNPQPIWIRIIYISHDMDSSMQKYPNYNSIVNQLKNDGILGKLVIDEMNLDGSVASQIINKQVTTNKYDMPQNGDFIPESYISKIIDDYKNDIQKDGPIYIKVTYVDHVSTAVNEKTGKLNLSLNVLRRSMYVNVTDVGGYSCVDNYCLYISPKGDVRTVYIDYRCVKYTKEEHGWQYCLKYKKVILPTSTTTTNVFTGPFKCFNGYAKNDYSYGKYDEPFSCVELCIGDKKIQGYCAQCGCSNRRGPVLNIFTQSGSTTNSYNEGFQVYYGKVRYCNKDCTDKTVCSNGGYGRDGIGYYDDGSDDYYGDGYYTGGGEVCHDVETCNLECGNWINLIPKVTATKYETVYQMNYKLGGAYYVYVVSEPLVKLGSGNNSYYSMTNIETGTLTFGKNNIGVSVLTLTKDHPVNIKNTSEKALAQEFYYYIVNPFGTKNELINVRNDTVNNLPESYYRNWNTTITFIEHYVNE